MKNLEKHIGPLQNSGLSHELSVNRYYKILAALQKKVHDRIPTQTVHTDIAATPTSYRTEFFEGENYKRAVIFLMTNGCEWALQSGHGCTMCGHLGKQVRGEKEIPTADFIKQFSTEFNNINFQEAPLLNIFNNGSFLNDREMSPEARRQILQIVNDNRYIKMLVIETRPEFVTQEKVEEIKRIIPSKHVELAIGLELKDDFYRTTCINKGFSLKCYDNAASIITEKIHLRTYAFLKPLFLTEKESIDQAVETVEHAFDRGSNTVSLEGCTIQDYTLIKFFYDLNLYTPPWLWSLVEVVKRARHNGKLLIGMFQFYPSPTKVPYNCPKCSDRVMDAIKEYNHSLDNAIFDGLDCECKSKWMEELNRPTEALKDRFDVVFKKLKLAGALAED